MSQQSGNLIRLQMSTPEGFIHRWTRCVALQYSQNPSSQEVIVSKADFPPSPGWQIPSWSTTFSSSSSPKPNFHVS
jgi:hypothetical protein